MEQTLTDQLRRHIRASDMTAYRVARLSKIDPATMSRFLGKKGFLSERGLNRLGQVLNLELVKRTEKGG